LTREIFCRLLSSPTCPVLDALGKKVSFEIAVGLNGRVWVCRHSLFLVCHILFFFFVSLNGHGSYETYELKLEKISFLVSAFLFHCSIQVKAASPQTTIIVANAIMNSETLSDAQQRIMVEKLLQRIQWSI